MVVNLAELRSKADGLSRDTAYNDRMFWGAVKHHAQQGDRLSYILYVHGDKHPDIPSFCYSPHARVMSAHLESSPRTMTVSHPESGKTLLHRSDMEMWIGRQTEMVFSEDRAISGKVASPSACYVMGTFENQAEPQVADIRNTLEFNDRYHELFPHVEPDKKKKWEQGKFFLKRPKRKSRPEPTLMAVGCEGDIQGLRFGKITVDDPISQKDAKSPTIVRDRVRWILATLERRVLQEGEMRYVFTRWHQRDMFKSLSRITPSLVMPVYGFWESHPEYGVTADTLWSQKWPKELVEVEHQKLIDAGESALWPLVWLCDPEVSTGDLFKREAFRYAASPVSMMIPAEVEV